MVSQELVLKWGAVFMGLGLTSMSLTKLLERLGLTQWKWLWLALFSICPGAIPFEALTLSHIFVLLRLRGKLVGKTLAEKAKTWLWFWFVGGVHFGLSLVVLAKYAPPELKHLLGRVSHVVPHDNVLMKHVPRSLLLAIGVPLTLLSEIGIVPCAATLLLAYAQLKYSGEDFSRGLMDHKPEKSGTVMVLIHGNQFNGCQYLFGKILMTSRLDKHVEFLSVDYFQNGPMMRDHAPATHTIEGCSAIVMEQIVQQLRDRGLCPTKVILCGHSLGGVVASYIAENYHDRLPVTDVVSWSAPLHGSHLITFARSNPTLEQLFEPRLNATITPDFDPKSEKLYKLRQQMKRSVESDRVNYFAITGGVDPLVAPSSALLPGIFKPENTLLLPHVGHYNIKISIHAWTNVINFLQDRIH